MKKHSILVTSTLLLFTAFGSAMAGSAAETVTVSDAYARAVPPGQPNSASFMTLTSKSDMDHALVEASSPAAGVVELHTHTMADGMMQMRRVEKIDIPAGGSTKLEPGGLHVMLIGLKQELKPEESISLTLVFEDGSKTEVTAPVRKLQMKMMKHGEMNHGEMKHEEMKGEAMQHEGMKME